MSEIRVGSIRDAAGTGAPTFTNGAIVTGVITATTFVGALTGTASNVTTNANLTGHVTSVGNTAVLGSFTSAQLATALTDETGSGYAVFATSPTLVNPILGVASASSINVSGISTLGTVKISSGIITATSGVVTYFGDGQYLTGLTGNPNLQTVLNTGNTSTIGINVTGVITATSFVGSGANLTGISSVSFATTSFGLSGSPAILVSSVGINTTTIPTKLYVQGNAAGNVVGLGSTSGTVTLDFTQGNSFSLTLTANTTLANPTGVTTGQSGIILIQEDGTGGYTCAWGTSWDFASSTAPTLTTTASALNALPYFARSTTSIVVGSVIAGIGTL